jgi:hypothetical protein
METPVSSVTLRSRVSVLRSQKTFLAYYGLVALPAQASASEVFVR